MQWPVNGVITSGYGYRTHPVLGYSRLHAGTDFGAPTGTPIVAATGGAVVSAGWMGGYGNAVVISHGGGLATLYAPQSRLAVSTGARVARGQVIGYVGATGLAEAPHLHYEFVVNGAHRNPRTVSLPAVEPLVGEQLLGFRAHAAPYLNQLSRLESASLYASAP